MSKRLFLLAPLFFASCFPYVYHDQERAQVKDIDVAATLEIARVELEEGGFDATLSVWAIRDQKVTAENARTIAELYSRYIDKVAAEKDRATADFGVWHFAWAISNLYRNGDASVKAELQSAYLDARTRPNTLQNFKDAATEHVNGEKVYMGDFHEFARGYARSHIVAPGNPDYLQSLAQYRENKETKS